MRRGGCTGWVYSLVMVSQLPNCGFVPERVRCHFRNFVFTPPPPTGIFTANATLIINVVDVNDHTPVFEKAVYRLTTPENVPIGSKIIKVRFFVFFNNVFLSF